MRRVFSIKKAIENNVFKEKEEKNMKKIISYLLCSVMMLSTFCVINASTNVDIDDLVVNDKTVNYTEDFEMTFEIDGLDYYPFIYHESNEWFIENVIGPTSCQEGYLYSKNLESGQIIKLVSQPVEIFREDESGVYFIYSNNIFFVDYNGNNIENVYAANGVLNTGILEVDGDDIYFCEGNKIVKYNRNNDMKSIVTNANDVYMLYVKSDNELIYKDSYGMCYLNKGEDNYNKVTILDEFSNLFSIGENLEINSLSSTTTQIDSNLALVRNGYPIGNSYFTGSYGNSTQCMGYAMWAFDKYSHLSDWKGHSSLDVRSGPIYFDTNADVISFFSGICTGAYVRLMRDSDVYNGFHSVFYKGKTSSIIYTYECNLYGNCEVTEQSRNLNQFRTFCDGVSDYATHDYVSISTYNVSYNSTYHKQKCCSSGCNGYRLEQHYNPISSSNTCAACGYQGTITARSPLD